MSETGKHGFNPGNSVIYLGDFCCQGQSASILSTPVVEVPAPRTVRACGYPVGSHGATDLIHSFRVSSGKKGFPQKSLHRFPKVKSDVKRTAFDTGEVCY